jgi:hypothetical protein
LYAWIGTESGYRFIAVSVFLIRLAVVVLSATAIGIALVPILVLIDLLDGGTGWGLCPDGLQACSNPYTTAAEFGLILTIGLFLSVLGIRLLMKLARRLRSDDYQVTQ